MPTITPITIDIFCSVIDNYGDIGVCFRLAKELSTDSAIVTLYVDDLNAFKAINPTIDANYTSLQKYNDITIKYWDEEPNDYEPSLVIIEAFGCKIGEKYTSKFTMHNLWINLEYLSAETWVEECHKLPSLQNNCLNKYFFFPGFTAKTGGLNFEKWLLDVSYQQAKEYVFKYLSLDPKRINDFIALIFTYETTSLFPLIEAILRKHHNAILLLPDSRSTKYLLEDNKDIVLKLQEQYPNSVWHKFSMVPQDVFNYILKASDFNIVRGEDSITQAIICGKPFLWHIYKQEENAHIDKLLAFCDMYLKDVTSNENKEILKLSLLSLNDESYLKDLSNNTIFDKFMIKYEQICMITKEQSTTLIKFHNLSSNLLLFIKEFLKQNN